MSTQLLQDLINIRDSLNDSKSFCYVYLLGSNHNDIDKLILMRSPHIPFEGKFPYLLIKHDDNPTILSHGLDYLLESETLSKGSTLNSLFTQLEQEEQDITKLIENRTNIIESICRIAGKGPFKTQSNTIMIIEKGGKKFIRKIDKRAKEVSNSHNNIKES